MSPIIFYLVYISTAPDPLTDEELKDILISAREVNTLKRLSGLLLYADGVFIHLLEGDETIVKQTYNIIEPDRRHQNPIILASGHYDQRTFDDWSMGYATADQQAKQMAGYIDTTRPGLFDQHATNPAIVTLKAFADSNIMTGRF